MLAKFVVTALIVLGALVSAISAEDGKCLTCGDSTQKNIIAANYNSGVSVEIFPGVCPKAININAQGLLPIAVLGSNDFDVNTTDPNSISLARYGYSDKIAPARWSYEDTTNLSVQDKSVNCPCHIAGSDGYTDLILEFDLYKLVKILDLQNSTGKSVILNLTGNASDNSFEAADCVNVIDEKLM